MKDLAITKDIGSELLKAAQDKSRKELTEKCVGVVQDLFSTIAASENTIEAETRKIGICRAKLSAIEAGEIKIQPAGTITYARDVLNLPLDQLLYNPKYAAENFGSVERGGFGESKYASQEPAK